MEWTKKDEDTLRQCKECMENCRHYHTIPSPWFELCIRMHDALEEAGLLGQKEFGTDYCDNCVFSVGGCRKAYRNASLDESRTQVVYCTGKVTPDQQAALDRAKKRMGRR